ncbi:hypothetical protein Y032_0056g2717 [Ancylostoma ceylanicum]|uniref:BPTI/Kunitz inhibitor domain-containing protein n=3 Tax=Ancylostoma ceylanicum TaxID=53326 RepID=A0A016U6Z5_9BILA|nr:hypothetical protein Y032_0056g2717 [Ancylostoma ceylanicum]
MFLLLALLALRLVYGSLDPCTLPLDNGSCSSRITRYGYDIAKGKCVQFMYGGCEGNENNFPTMDICKNECDRNIPRLTEPEKVPVSKKVKRQAPPPRGPRPKPPSGNRKKGPSAAAAQKEPNGAQSNRNPNKKGPRDRVRDNGKPSTSQSKNDNGAQSNRGPNRNGPRGPTRDNGKPSPQRPKNGSGGQSNSKQNRNGPSDPGRNNGKPSPQRPKNGSGGQSNPRPDRNGSPDHGRDNGKPRSKNGNGAQSNRRPNGNGSPGFGRNNGNPSSSPSENGNGAQSNRRPHRKGSRDPVRGNVLIFTPSPKTDIGPEPGALEKVPSDPALNKVESPAPSPPQQSTDTKKGKGKYWQKISNRIEPLIKMKEAAAKAKNSKVVKGLGKTALNGIGKVVEAGIEQLPNFIG